MKIMKKKVWKSDFSRCARKLAQTQEKKIVKRFRDIKERKIDRNCLLLRKICPKRTHIKSHKIVAFVILHFLPLKLKRERRICVYIGELNSLFFLFPKKNHSIFINGTESISPIHPFV